MRQRVGVIGCLVAAVLILGVPPLPAAGPLFKQAAPAGKPATHKVENGPFRVELSLKGVLEAEEMTEVVLRPESWTSLSVLKAVDHGRLVKKGETIITLDPEKIDRAIRDMEADRYLAELSLKQAEEELALLEKSTPLDLSAAELAKRYADEDLKRYKEQDRPESVKTSEFTVRNMANFLEYAKEELRQLEKMYKAKDLTEETEEIILKRQRHQVETADFQFKHAEYLREHTLKVDLPRRDRTYEETAQKQALSLEKAKITLPMALTQKKLSLDKLRYEQGKTAEKLKQLQKDRELFVVKSPADGVLYYGKCSRGQWTSAAVMGEKLRRGGNIMPEEVVATIVKPRPVFVRASVEEKDVQYLKPGLAGKVTPTAFPDLKLPATVADFSTVPIASGTFEAKLKIALDKEPDVLMPGLACSVKLIAYQKEDALTVPSGAVFADDGDEEHSYVYLVGKDGKHEKRPVTVGKKTAAKTEILQGLQAGDEILTEKPEAKKGM
jgi:HlyD family secretion protein